MITTRPRTFCFSLWRTKIRFFDGFRIPKVNSHHLLPIFYHSLIHRYQVSISWTFANLKFHSVKSKIEFSGNQFKNSTVLSPYHVITEGAEMEQGIYKIRFDLFVNGNHESDSKDLEGQVTSCETEFIYDEKSVLTETDQYSFRLLPGKTSRFYKIRLPNQITKHNRLRT